MDWLYDYCCILFSSPCLKEPYICVARLKQFCCLVTRAGSKVMNLYQGDEVWEMRFLQICMLIEPRCNGMSKMNWCHPLGREGQYPAWMNSISDRHWWDAFLLGPIKITSILGLQNSSSGWISVHKQEGGIQKPIWRSFFPSCPKYSSPLFGKGGLHWASSLMKRYRGTQACRFCEFLVGPNTEAFHNCFSKCFYALAWLPKI